MEHVVWRKEEQKTKFVCGTALTSSVAGYSYDFISFSMSYPPRPPVRNIKPDDLVLPRPPISVEGYNTVILSWVAAMKYVGMSKYSEDLTYSDDVPESMNDASLEDGVVEPLPRRVEEIFREFKMNLSQGVVRRRRIQCAWRPPYYCQLPPSFLMLLTITSHTCFISFFSFTKMVAVPTSSNHP